MVALSVTAAQVIPVSGDKESGIAGAVITQGQSVYKSSTDGLWYPAKNNGTADEAGGTNVGIAVSGAAIAGQGVVVAIDGAIVTLGVGAAPAPTVPYFVGSAAGSLVPNADLATTQKGTQVCTGLTLNQVLVRRVYHPNSVKP